jgi:meckelin
MVSFDMSDAACAAYRGMAISTSRASPYASFPYNDQPRGLPWLIWGAVSFVSSTTIATTLLPITSIAVSPVAPAITYILGLYTINGTFLGFEKLTTQFQLCTGVESTQTGWNQAGKIYQNACSLTLQANSGFKDQSLFYEICKSTLVTFSCSTSFVFISISCCSSH